MDIEALAAKFELIDKFKARQALAAEAAQGADTADLGAVVRLLGHSAPAVRLGAIEVLAAARFRPALKYLAAATVQRTGEERVFAARTLALLAKPEDRTLLEPLARSWLKTDDAFLHGHAETVLAMLDAPATPESEPEPAPADPGIVGFGITSPDGDTRKQAIARTLEGDPGDAARIFIDALREPQPPGIRLDLVTALEQLGADAFAGAAIPFLNVRPLDGDVVTLVARALGRHLPELSDQRIAEVREALDYAHRNLSRHEFARAAIDEALLAKPELSIDAIVIRLDRISSQAALRLAMAFVDLPRERRLALLGDLLDALAKVPRRTLLFVETLDDAWSDLRPPRRKLIRQLCDTACADPLPAKMAGNILAVLGRLYGKMLRPGDTPPDELLAALDRSDDVAVALAAIAVHRAVGTETSARHLAEFLDEPDARVRDAAQGALRGFSAPHVDVAFADDGSVNITAVYHTPSGEPLTVGNGLLVSPGGTRYVLDADGNPVEESATEWRGCKCCERPRALVRERGHRPRCPITRESHLVGDDGPTLERKHPLGGCTACESVRPLVRHGDVVRCEDCHTEHMQRQGRYVKRRSRRRRLAADAPAEGPAEVFTGPPPPLERSDLPDPPSLSDLQLVEPTIRHAMAGNVFLVGDTLDNRWVGSGVIVARDGDEIAILTNRHVVEDETPDGNRLVATLRVYAISGELVPATVRWRAGKGLDLAMITARLREPDRVSVVELQEGPCLVGSRLFAIGNPLGLSWSYSSGTLAGLRNFKTGEDLEVRLIQSHVNMAQGSSGGGLYHEQGHLIGVNVSVLTSVGGEQNFSIAMSSILAALRRERVSFAGRPLVSPT